VPCIESPTTVEKKQKKIENAIKHLWYFEDEFQGC
jgi:hypothetical protein